jgi:hypothetical protein
MPWMLLVCIRYYWQSAMKDICHFGSACRRRSLPRQITCSEKVYDGIARHTQEGLDFVARSAEVGFREAVRDRDRPFGDYGERPTDG